MPRSAAPIRTAEIQRKRIEWANVHKPPVTVDGKDYTCTCLLEPDRIPHSHLDQIGFEYGPAPLCLSGGFGCIGAGTKIRDVRMNADVPVEWYFYNKVGPTVAAWDKSHFVPAWASIPWIKGFDRLYRVKTLSGRSVVVTENHRFLSNSRWESLASGLRIGSPLHGFDASLLRSISDSGLPTHGEDDWHLNRTLEGSQGDCRAYCRSCGGQLPLAANTALMPSQPQGGVLGHNQGGFYSGVQGFGLGGSLGSLLYPHSSLGAFFPAAPLGPVSSVCENAGTVALVHPSQEVRVPEQSQDKSYFGTQEHGSQAANDSVSNDSCADRITGIEDLGSGIYYDLEVPFYHNYVAEGLVHHNSAKTFALCQKALWLSDMYPGNRGVIARRQWVTLKDTTMSTFFKICPSVAYAEQYGGRRVDSEKYLRLAKSQSEILWLHLDQDDVDTIIRGLEINWFLIDQAEEIPEQVFATLMTRLGRWDKAQVPQAVLEQYGGEDRWPWKNPDDKPIVPTYAMLACNPDVETHWIWRRFHEESPDWKQTYAAQGYKMITMRSDENRYLPKQNLDEMLKADETFQRRFVRGEWGIPEGQIHEVQKESIIEGTPEIAAKLFRTCSIYRTMDHGDSSPTASGWFGVDADGNVFHIAEYYRPNLLISQHRRNMMLMEQGMCNLLGLDGLRYRDQLADPSIFYKTMQKYGGRYSVRDDYEDRNPAHGFSPDDAIYWNPADNDELGTRNTINEYLRLQGTGQYKDGQEIPRVHPLTGEKGLWPRLFFIKKTEAWPYGADRAILETRSQKRERIGMELGRPTFSDDREKGIPDHAYDFVRYMMASRAAKFTHPAAKYSKKSFFGVRDSLVEFQRKGGWRKLREAAYARN